MSFWGGKDISMPSYKRVDGWVCMYACVGVGAGGDNGWVSMRGYVNIAQCRKYDCAC